MYFAIAGEEKGRKKEDRGGKLFVPCFFCNWLIMFYINHHFGVKCVDFGNKHKHSFYFILVPP